MDRKTFIAGVWFHAILAILAVVIAVVSLKSIWDRDKQVVLKSEWVVEEIHVTRTNTPKHWYVEYVRLADGRLFKESGKHCNHFNRVNPQIGARYSIQVKYETIKDHTGKVGTYRITRGCDLVAQLTRPVYSQ